MDGAGPKAGVVAGLEAHSAQAVANALGLLPAGHAHPNSWDRASSPNTSSTEGGCSAKPPHRKSI